MFLPADRRPGPLLKWPGGKRAELPMIADLVGDAASGFHEPFVGGGAVWLATDPDVPAVVNDACADLIALYRLARDHRDELYDRVAAWARWWDGVAATRGLLVDLQPAAGAGRPLDPGAVDALAAAVVEVMPAGLADPASVAEGLVRRVRDKARRIAAGQQRRGEDLPPDDVVANLEAAVRSVVYYRLRGAYNAARRAGDVEAVAAGLQPPASSDVARVSAFWLLRELAYAAMFRFNNAGDFNVPYGGVSYNARDLGAIADRLHDPDLQARLATTTLNVGDFATALRRHPPGQDDLVFVDPPYAARFSTYDDDAFTPEDHRRLADELAALPCRFVLVVSDAGATERIYDRPGWRVSQQDKTWAWTIKQRNDRRARLLVVTNDAEAHERATA